MRYDTPIYFEKLSPGAYDETVGDYGDPVVVSAKRLASVVNTSDKQMHLIYGGRARFTCEESAGMIHMRLTLPEE